MADDAQVLHLDPGYPRVSLPGVTRGQAAEHPGGQTQLRGHIAAARGAGDHAPAPALGGVRLWGVTRLTHTSCKRTRVVDR